MLAGVLGARGEAPLQGAGGCAARLSLEWALAVNQAEMSEDRLLLLSDPQTWGQASVMTHRPSPFCRVGKGSEQQTVSGVGAEICVLGNDSVVSSAPCADSMPI